MKTGLLSAELIKIFNPDEKADKCIQCKACEDKCPQKIIISEWMPKVYAELSK